MRILVSTGEPSGDVHAAGVVRALFDACPDAEIEGIGGPRLHQAGVHLLERMEALSASGLVEVAGRMATHLRLLQRLRRRIAAGGYDLVLLVDYPGFHLRLARAACSAGVPVLYYIAPQLWAWGGWRIRQLRRSVRHLAVILPFEETFFTARGVPTAFVGHPLLDQQPLPHRSQARSLLGLEDQAPLVALFPGSRPHEHALHRDVFALAARRLRETVGQVHIMMASRDFDREPSHEQGGLPTRDPTTLLAAADAVLCKAGTTTLEAAIADVPMVIAHRMHPVTFSVARRLVRVPHVGLVNLLAERRLAPEFLQAEAQPEALAAAVAALLDDGGAAHHQREGFVTVRARLGEPGAGRRVAELALRLAA